MKNPQFTDLNTSLHAIYDATYRPTAGVYFFYKLDNGRNKAIEGVKGFNTTLSRAYVVTLPVP